MMYQTDNIRDLNAKLTKLGKAFKNLDKSLLQEIQGVLYDSANSIRTDIVLSMRNTPKASHYYMRGNKRHYPSQEYKPPAIDSGDLVKSILFDATPTQLVIGSIIRNPDYPLFLEEGTKHIAKRPWLEPAVYRAEHNIIEQLGAILPEAVDKVFNRG